MANIIRAATIPHENKNATAYNAVIQLVNIPRKILGIRMSETKIDQPDILRQFIFSPIRK